MPDDDPKKHEAKGPKAVASDRGKGMAEMFRDIEIGDTPEKKTDVSRI